VEAFQDAELNLLARSAPATAPVAQGPDVALLVKPWNLMPLGEVPQALRLFPAQLSGEAAALPQESPRA